MALPRFAPQAAAGHLRRLDFSRTDPLDLLTPRPGPPVGCQPSDGPARVAGRLAELFARPGVVTLASGDLARCLTLAALLSPGDQVIVDAGADRAMFETVVQVAKLHRAPSGSVAAVERRLRRLARQPRPGRLFVVVPAVARLSSVMAELHELCALSARHGATLIVDLSQDLGVMGEAGLGVAEMQGCLDRIDVVLGDLSTFCATPGGFAAFRDPALRDQVAAAAAPPMSPASAAATLAALDLTFGAEGRRRRRHLHSLTLRLRNHLLADQMPVMGHPSPVVPVRLAPATAGTLTAMAAAAGVKVPLVQAPEVAGHAPRWLIRLSAGHGLADIDDMADTLRDVIRAGARRKALSPA